MCYSEVRDRETKIIIKKDDLTEQNFAQNKLGLFKAVAGVAVSSVGGIIHSGSAQNMLTICSILFQCRAHV